EVDQRERLADLAHVGEHGDQQVDLAVRRRTQNGAQLREEHGRIGEAPADGTQSQGRIEVRVVANRFAVERLVGAHVDGADRDGHALHAFYRALVRLVLL